MGFLLGWLVGFGVFFYLFVLFVFVGWVFFVAGFCGFLILWFNFYSSSMVVHMQVEVRAECIFPKHRAEGGNTK